ncbi:MAG: hypothetical protein K5924_10105 [Chloroflexi bacterium]|nr:hypothetical protein [Chloroflexota bacterium]
MPSPAEILGRVVRFVGEVLGASSLRFEVGTTLVVLGVVLVLLQLVARPVSRWVTSDAAGLAGVGRAMALAAEAGTDAVVSLGGAGIARSSDALGRLQTVAALPILGHVARAAARSGVPLRVLTNDPVAGVMAASTIDAAHATTATLERQGRTRIVMVGEGRPAIAGLAMTARARPAAAFAFGSLREEALLHLDGLRSGAGSLTTATAEAAQASTVRIGGGETLIGPQLYQATADLRSSVDERTMVMAANRLIGLAVALILVGTLLALAGIVDIGSALTGIVRG